MTPPDARRRRFGPVAPPPSATVAVGVGEALLVPRKLSLEEGERRGREAIQEGLLRPADSHTADIEGALLVWVPVWRVDLAADSFHVGVARATDAKGRLKWALPTGGTRHLDAVELVGARKLLPFDITPSLELPLAAMKSRAEVALDDGEELSPDVSRDEAVAEASARVRRAVQPARAIYRDTEVRVRSVALCHVPVWLRRYRYAGEAARAREGESEECHVAVSAHDGRVLSERHPSAMRAIAGRVKRLFRRG
ncbi:MAG: hypothetical protein U0324_25490 [Polyangiales bacterium]